MSSAFYIIESFFWEEGSRSVSSRRCWTHRRQFSEIFFVNHPHILPRVSSDRGNQELAGKLNGQGKNRKIAGNFAKRRKMHSVLLFLKKKIVESVLSFFFQEKYLLHIKGCTYIELLTAFKIEKFRKLCKCFKTSPNKLPSIVLLIRQDPGKPHLCPSLVSYPEFRLNPACSFVSSNRHRVKYRVQSTHDIF